METNGNVYQRGFPDLYITMESKGWERWVEVKNPESYKFTVAQLDNFPFIPKVWILVAATQAEYEKLFKPPNWRDYLCLADKTYLEMKSQCPRGRRAR